MVKLSLGGCHGSYRFMPKPGEGDILELKESCVGCPPPIVHHRIVLPHEWRVRVATVLKPDSERWKSMTQEAVQVIEENRR